MEELVFLYKKVKVNSKGTFNCEELGLFEFKSFEKIKSEIKKFLNEKLEVKKAYLFEGYGKRGNLIEVEIIGRANDKYALHSFWIKDRYGDRRKEDTLYLINDNNRKIVDENNRIREEIEALEGEKDKLLDGLERLE